jgi:hypothetical protein
MNGVSPNEHPLPSSDPLSSETLQSPVQLDNDIGQEDANSIASPTSVPLQELDHFSMIQSIGVFILAGVSEIGGGWLMWKAIRQEFPAWIGVIGGFVLALYGSKRAVHALFSCGLSYQALLRRSRPIMSYCGFSLGDKLGDRTERTGIPCVHPRRVPFGTKHRDNGWGKASAPSARALVAEPHAHSATSASHRLPRARFDKTAPSDADCGTPAEDGDRHGGGAVNSLGCFG